jgi:hypothetical protein
MITISSNPYNWQNSFNEMVFNVSSTNALASGFQFLVDVNVSGQTNPVTRLTYPKQPNTGAIEINLNEVIQNYVSYDLLSSFNASGTQRVANARAPYWIGFGEVYNNASGIPTIYSNLATFGSSGSPKYGTNAVFEFQDWNASGYQSYALSRSNKKSLNQETFTDVIRLDQNRVLQFFDVSGNIFDVNNIIYNEVGTALYGSVQAVTRVTDIVSINVGKREWENMGSTWNTFLNNPAASYIEVIIRDNTAATLYTRRMNLDLSCPKYDIYRLHWLNSLGGFDAFNFNKVSVKKTNIERKQFKRFQPLNYSDSFRGKTNYFTKYTDSITLNSDGLTDAQWEGLKELLTSPVIYLEQDNNTLLSVNILESNYDELNYSTNRTISNLVITIEYAFDNYKQTL